MVRRTTTLLSSAPQLPSCSGTGNVWGKCVPVCVSVSVGVNVSSLLLWESVRMCGLFSGLCWCELMDRCLCLVGRVAVLWLPCRRALCLPIGPQMGVRCHWSRTGPAWCTGSTASATDRKTNKEDRHVNESPTGEIINEYWGQKHAVSPAYYHARPLFLHATLAHLVEMSKAC